MFFSVYLHTKRRVFGRAMLYKMGTLLVDSRSGGRCRLARAAKSLYFTRISRLSRYKYDIQSCVTHAVMFLKLRPCRL